MSFNTSIHSSISRALPILVPKGLSILVKIHITVIPNFLPKSIIILDNFLALCKSFTKAPEPTLTSNTSFLAPSAIFLLIIEEAIKGRDSTVAVTSLNAYIFLSATAISSV